MSQNISLILEADLTGAAWPHLALISALCIAYAAMAFWFRVMPRMFVVTSVLGVLLVPFPAYQAFKHYNLVNEIERSSACDSVLADISTGKLRVLRSDDADVVRDRCGRSEFVAAQNSTDAVLEIEDLEAGRS